MRRRTCPICSRRCKLWARLAPLAWATGTLLPLLALCHNPPRRGGDWTTPRRYRSDPDDTQAWPRPARKDGGGDGAPEVEGLT
jgi:hypothetical protein